MNRVQLQVYCIDINAEVAFFTDLGFRILQVFPADDPREMVLVSDGIVLKLVKLTPFEQQKELVEITTNNITLLIHTESETASKTSPSGVLVKLVTTPDAEPQQAWPDAVDSIINHFNATESWVTGRAGMLYRDLIVNRLSGAIIASNIMIPEGGPVPDHVHYHSIQFQLIFCTQGWVKVVYEDQGEPFILSAGDCVTQPPGIRHQVLEASDGLEVVEIGLPAEHMTTLDHSMQLPTERYLPARTFKNTLNQEQKFSHHQQVNANWLTHECSGLMRSETNVKNDSGGLAAVNVIKAFGQSEGVSVGQWSLHHQDKLRFYYLVTGHVTHHQRGKNMVDLKSRDSFTLAQDRHVDLSEFSEDFECIEFIWSGA